VLYYPAATEGRQHTCAIIARVGPDGGARSGRPARPATLATGRR
jgi:hypothetical protein